MLSMVPFLITSVFVIPAAIIIVRANLRYRRHLKSLTPDELKKFKREESDDLHIW